MPSIHSTPFSERPRERLQSLGSEKLSIAELIAIIISTGTKGKSALEIAQELVCLFTPLSRLLEASVEELCQIKGLGLAKAVKLKAAFTISEKFLLLKTPLPRSIKTPQAASVLIKEQIRNDSREVFVALLLDIKCTHICTETVSIGTLNQTLIHPREIFYPAIRHKAASMILGHNHPSGDPTPSKEDLNITRTLVQSGELLRIPIHDHLIIGSKSFTSLKEVHPELFI